MALSSLVFGAVPISAVYCYLHQGFFNGIPRFAMDECSSNHDRIALVLDLALIMAAYTIYAHHHCRIKKRRRQKRKCMVDDCVYAGHIYIL